MGGRRSKSEAVGHSDFAALLAEVKGFSERNIDRMIAFYREYSNPAEISPPPVTKLQPRVKAPPMVAKSTPSKEVQPPVAQLPSDQKGQLPIAQAPWAHNVLLMQKVKDLPTRRWYMEQTLKDPYIFDFLTLTEPFQERELETELVRHVEKFLLELGQGFAFVGRQCRLDVGDEDFYIDLLFYHLRLRAFVVIELKKDKFKPEYAGKLNFYCNVVNERLRHRDDAPTIGLILCQTRDRLLAEYSFAGIDKPIGISTYELSLRRSKR